MFRIPENILDKLKCHLCDGYLNAKPVVVKDDQQICSKCYRILPPSERAQCVREISFEAVGSCLIFPCRYHKMGCEYTFTWDHDNGHESECTKKYFTVPDVLPTNKKLSGKSLDSPHNSYESYCAKYGKIASTSLIKAEMRTGTANIGFNFEEEPTLVKSTSLERYQHPTMKLPEILPYSEPKNTVKSSTVYENIYSTISTTTTTSTCISYRSYNAQAKKHNTHACDNCRENGCIVCPKTREVSSRTACKNAPKGCKKILLPGDVAFHRDNCKYNEINCPINNCQTKEMMEELKQHLQLNHSKQIILSNELSKALGSKDLDFVFLCYDGVFKFSYFNYGVSVEIIVVYLGPCAKASSYSYEVSVEVNKKNVTKVLDCANWNDFSLASGISFDKSELVSFGEKRISCLFNVKIYPSQSYKQAAIIDLVQ